MPIKNTRKKNIDKSKKSQSVTIDIKNIVDIYKKTYQEISKLNNTQLSKLQDQYWDPKDSIYNFLSQFIEKVILNYEIDVKIKIMTEIKGIKYFESKSKSKDACMSQYKNISKLGAGAYGTAYLGTKNNNNYVIKAIDVYNDENKNNLNDIKTEIETLKQMSKLGISPKYHTHYFCKKVKGSQVYTVFIVMDYMDTGTLSNYLQENPKGLTADLKKQIKDKLAIMHKNGYIHDDLHEGNILLNRENSKLKLYIADFGLSKSLESQIDKVRNEFDQMKSYDKNNIQYLLKQKSKGLYNFKTLTIDQMITKKLIKIKL